MPERIENIVSDDWLMTFGKNHGQKIGDVDCGYLLWMIEQHGINLTHPTEYLYAVHFQDILLEEYEEKYGKPWSHKY